MGDEAKGAKPFDPMEPWRGARDVYLDAWAKTMVDMVNTEAYAQATGTMLDMYLTASTPFREAVEKAMLKTLEQLAMPSQRSARSGPTHIRRSPEKRPPHSGRRSSGRWKPRRRS